MSRYPEDIGWCWCVFVYWNEKRHEGEFVFCPQCGKKVKPLSNTGSGQRLPRHKPLVDNLATEDDRG